MTGMTMKPAFERQLIGLAVAACFAGIVHANPTGPAVASGSASFATSGNTLTVTNTPGAIINWQAFSIRPDEVTRFIQSGAASAVLNRVTGPGQSAILGQLLSNGRVFLINPNGVAVGAGARIDTAGFVASSLNLSNEDFLAGRFRFTDPGNAGKVTNAGSINAHSGGPVYLIAPTVENHGVITAPNGDILLAAGKSVELVSTGSPHLRVQVEAGGEAVNVGQLLADSGRVGLYGAAIRNAGTISADSASVNAAGNVVLKASRDVTLERTSVVSASGAQGGAVHVQAEQGTLLVDGRVDAKGTAGRGGDVKLLGTQVGLVGTAAVDASGASGGGTVLVGGDYQGKNSDIQNAARVVLASDAKIVADATERGDGGRVIVWSDEYTGFYGAINARGGAAGGNGGLVETSSKDNLQALGFVDAAATLGRAGEWLLDPSDVTITTSTSGGSFGGASPNIFTPTAAAANANAATINASLNGGTSVTINTASAAGGNGDIIVNSAISKTTNTGSPTLTLNAVRDITVNAAMQGSAAGNVLNVAMNAGRAVAFGGGGSINTRNGNVTVTAGTTASLGAINTGTGALSVTSNGNVTQTGTLTVGGTATFAPGAGNSVTLATAANNFGTVVLNNGANATIRDSNALAFGNTNLTGTLNATAGGAITDSGTIAVGGLASFKTLINAGAAITLDTAANSFGSLSVQARNAADTANAAGAITVSKTGPLVLETVRTTSTAGFTTSGNIAQTGTSTVTVGGAATFAPGAGNNVTLANAANNFGTVAFANGANATIRDTNALIFGNTSLTGTLNATAGGAITDSGTITIGGLASFKTLGVAAITLDTAANSFGSLSAQARNAADTANAAGAITVTRNGALVLETVGTTANATFSSGTGGNITQTGTSTVTVGGTATFTPGAGNSVTLANAGNDFGTVRQTNGANFTLRDTNGVILGASTITGTLNVTAGGSVTQSGVVAAGALTANLSGAASQLNLGTSANNVASLGPVTAPAGFTLTNGNNATTLNGNIATTNGPVTISTGTAAGGYTQNDFDVATGSGDITINANTVNIAANTGNNAFQTTGTLTLRPNTAGTTMSLAGVSTFDLSAAEITRFTAGAGTPTSIVIGNATNSTAAMSIGAPVNFGAKTLTLNAGSFTDGAVAGRTITAGTLNLNARTGAIGAAGAGAIDVAATNLTVNTVNQNAFVNATGGVSFGPGGSSTGTGSLTLNASGNVTQTGSVTVGGTATLAAGAANDITLNNAANNFGTVVFSSGNAVSLVDANALTVGASSVGTLTARTLSGNLTLGGNVVATGAGDAIVLVAAGNFQNPTSRTLAPGTGRWLVYSTNPASDTRGGLVYDFKQYSATYGLTPVLGAGKGFLYSVVPSITATLSGTATKAYDGTTVAPIGGLTVSPAAGAIDGDTVSLALSGASYDTKHVGAGKLVTATGATVTANNAGRPVYGYQVNLATASASVGTINPAALTVTAQPDARVYNGTTSSTVAPVVSGTLYDPVGTAPIQAYDTKNVGTGKTLTASGLVVNDGNGGANYGVSYVANTTGAITPAALSLTAQTNTKTYDGTTSAAATPTVAGLQAGDTVTGLAQVYADKNAGTGKALSVSSYTVNDGNGGANYTVSTVNDATGVINPAALTITAQTNTKTYDGTTSAAATPTVAGLQVGDTVTGLAQVYADKNAGSGKTLSVAAYSVNDGNGGANYTVSTVNDTTGVINPAALTIAADSKTRQYGDANPPLTATFTGLVPSDTPADIAGLTISTPAVPASNVGPYAITPAGGVNANYTISYVNGVLTIAPAALTITANNAARPEDQPNPPFSATYAGFKNGETPAALGGALAFSTPATIASPPGGYAITPFGQTATNYTITYVDGVLTITPLPVVPVPPVVSGVAAADNALITATQRSADAEGEVAPRLPDAKGVDCLALERAGQRRVLNRCY